MHRSLILKITVIIFALTLSACSTQHTVKMTKHTKTIMIERFHAKFANTGLTVGSTRHSVLLNKPTDRWFSKGSTLNANSKQQLAYIANIVLRVGYNNITVSGYSDNVGGLANNSKKSTVWAQSVYKYLKSKGVASSKLSYKGHGEFQPITSNFNETGRRENRRVEIKID
jgi:outer membrane protein OmpA-like peptidoglycan-associated protein